MCIPMMIWLVFRDFTHKNRYFTNNYGTMGVARWERNVAMDNHPFRDDFPY